MVGGRLYRVATEQVAVSAAQDLQGYLCEAGKFAWCEGFWVGDVDQTLPLACSLNLALIVMTATVSVGTGGTSSAPQAWDVGDSAAAGSAWQNATSLATTTGTAYTRYPTGCHLYQGLDVRFPEPVPLLGGEAAILRLIQAPAASSNLSSGLWIREFGG